MNYLQKFAANRQGRDFVCGDLHGQLDALFDALSACDFDCSADRLFSVGDLVDRGVDSKRTFELLEQPWFNAVRGNHEVLMFDAYNSRQPKDIALWMNNGGRRWVDDCNRFFDTEVEFSSLVERQQQHLPWAIELALVDGRRIGLVHAECPCPDWNALEAALADQEVAGGITRYNAVWSRNVREPLFAGPVAGIDLTVHGHCIFAEPVRRFNSCFIDTGACMQSSRFFGLVKKPQGYLSLIRAEELFDIAHSDWSDIQSLTGRRRR